MSEDKNLEETKTLSSNINNTEDDAQVNKKGVSKKFIVATTGIVVAALVAAGGVGYGVYTNHEYKGYQKDKAAVQTLDTSLTLQIKSAKDVASKYTAKQLKDPKTLDILNKAIKNAEKFSLTNENAGQWVLWQIQSARKGIKSDTVEINSQIAALKNAMKAVTDSKTAKDLDTAKADLKGTLDSAGKTLADSDGKVADNATRDSLKKTIDAAQKVYDKKDVTDPKAYSDEKGKLEKAVKVVNDSIQAKQAADEKAAQEAADEKAAQEAAAAQAAAEAQAQAQAAQQQAQFYSGYTGGGYSNYSNTSTGGGYSAPRHNYTPPTNNGGGSSSGPVVTGGGHAYTCEEEGDCSDRWGAPDQYD